jgi:hypothetical protein
MSAKQSHLSDAHYGYDFAVATTQESINATMKEYLYNTVFQPVKMYWNQDANGNPVPVSQSDLLQQTHGTDPLNVPSWKQGDPMSQDITNINNSNFYFAFEAAIGIPSQMAPQNIPDIVTLQQTSQSVVFNLLCANFNIVTCNFGRQGLTSFQHFTQPNDKPWMFTSTVMLKNIFNNTNLPPAVQNQLNNLGPQAFSVQQLIFDLDNAALESTPTISGIDPGTPTYTLLSQVFLGAYFNAMKQTAQPVLNYSIVEHLPNPDTSTLKLSNLALIISPYLNPATQKADTPDLNTLNYQCEVNGNTLPPAVPFNWNWVEANERSQFNGAIAINRNTFANYFKTQMINNVTQNCYKSFVRVWMDGLYVKFQWQLTAGQTPTITTPATGQTVVQFDYTSTYSDCAGLNCDMGESSLTPKYSAKVDFVGNTIVITQNLQVHLYVRSLQSSFTWNSVNKTITDTYTLAVTQDGRLTATLSSNTVDNSDPVPSTNWFINLFTSLNELVKTVDDWSRNFASITLHDIPVSVAQQFVFPGGKTFAFKDVVFSDYQDLISHITYVQPS